MHFDFFLQQPRCEEDRLQARTCVRRAVERMIDIEPEERMIATYLD